MIELKEDIEDEIKYEQNSIEVDKLNFKVDSLVSEINKLKLDTLVLQ